MVRVVFVQESGDRQVVEADEGVSLMEAAIRNGVAGIEADCGGACSCGTCHVHIPGAWQAMLPQPLEDEEAMLELVAPEKGDSRLSCQVKIFAELDGIEVIVPAVQSAI